MKGIKSVISILLVLVMLGSMVNPVFAVNVEQKTPACPSCSKLTTGNSKVTVIEINGIERNEILAKALKNKNSEMLMNLMRRKGYKPELLKSKVRKIIIKNAMVTIAVIPFSSRYRDSMAGLVVYMLDRAVVGSLVVELHKDKDGNVSRTIYYINSDGKLVSIESTSDFLRCLWACAGWEHPIVCIITCGACSASIPWGILSCIGCGLCIGHEICCVGKCGKKEWGEPFCAAIYTVCVTGSIGGIPASSAVACAIYSGCEGYC